MLKRKYIFCSAIFSTLLFAQAPQYTIQTVAGCDAVRDGGPAQFAILDNAAGIALDSRDNLYIADAGADRVRKVTPDRGTAHLELMYAEGLIETIAGLGAPYFSGDRGPAARAHLSGPSALAIGPDGTLYIADTGNLRIRKIGPDGIIQTIAGNGRTSVQPSAMVLDTAGNLYFSEGQASGRIRKLSPDGTLTTYAGDLRQPAGLAMDSAGNLYVAETARHMVRKITPDGTVSTVAGTGTPAYSGDRGPAANATLRGPRALVIDANGVLYIADSGNRALRRVSADGRIETALRMPVAPVAMALAPSGALFLSFGNQVNIWNPPAASLGAPVAGDSHRGTDGISATESLVFAPRAVAVHPSGPVYIAQPGSGGLRGVDPSGVIGIIANELEIAAPMDLDVDRDGNLLVADAASNRVLRLTADGVIETVANNVTNPRAIAADADGNLYIVDWVNYRVRKVSAEGRATVFAGTGRRGSSGDDGPATAAELNSPSAIAVDWLSGAVYVVDSGTKIRKIDRDGIITSVYASETAIGAIAADLDGTLLLSAGHAVYRLTSAGLERVAGGDIPGFAGDGGPARRARLNTPSDLFVDASGAIYIVDRGNHRIRKLSRSE